MVGSKTQDLCGYIAFGHPSDKIAYMIPAQHAFAEIEDVLQDRLNLSLSGPSFGHSSTPIGRLNRPAGLLQPREFEFSDGASPEQETRFGAEEQIRYRPRWRSNSYAAGERHAEEYEKPWRVPGRRASFKNAYHPSIVEESEVLRPSALQRRNSLEEKANKFSTAKSHTLPRNRSSEANAPDQFQARVSRRSLLPDTLDVYGIQWEYDKVRNEAQIVLYAYINPRTRLTIS